MHSRLNDDDQFEQMEDLDNLPAVRNMPRPKTGGKRKAKKPANIQAKQETEQRQLALVAAEVDEKFEFTYKAGELEAEWLYSSLQQFRDQKWIDDVLRVVKGGKEASVYMCLGHESAGEEYLAAKVYRPRKFRNLKNDWVYREGRAFLDESGNVITNHGLLHAIEKKTQFGYELMHNSWLVHEYKTMQVLHSAGADVPRPFAAAENAILMQYFGDEALGAPALNDVELDRREAKVLFERVLHNIDVMLQNNRVHGDLSAYNVLYWEGEIVIIDFPQVIDPENNPSAYKIFERDVARICEYFQRQGVPSQPRKIAESLWQKFHHRFVPQVNPSLLDEDNEAERTIWESLKNTKTH